ncbi:PHP domain-containing protein [Gorillibacterium timonense]|uniref:PHP domain-containing protein n=1 Tax=Gorillibacterium timonense TaxID=1689269 RepID=UPI000A68D511|nr:PHP domain-containing protein [Gorillibacterium timonense]
MAVSGFADLHTHTTASDGLHAPEDNVRMAKEAGLAAVAITDHDTLAGLDSAIREGAKLGITVVPGVEISTVANGQDIHVLGYYMNRNDPLFLERLAELRSVRDRRNEMMLAKLNELGIPIKLEEIAEIKAKKSGDKPGETIGRPHIADWLIQHGYVSSLREAFDRYLGKGGQAYVNPPRIHPTQAIVWIHEAGGSAVLAHPGLYGEDELVRELIQAGLDGIEAYHSDHGLEQEEAYRRMAEEAGLFVTGGSDFHGTRQGDTFHGPIGNRRVGIEVLERLQDRGRGNRI